MCISLGAALLGSAAIGAAGSVLSSAMQPDAPDPIMPSPPRDVEPLKNVINFVTGMETFTVDDGTGRKKRVTRALPKELIMDVLPEASEEDLQKLQRIPFIDKLDLTQVREIVKNPEQREVLLQNIRRVSSKELDQYSLGLLGKQLLGEYANNVQTLMSLDPKQAMQLPAMQSYKRMQEYALEKNFDLAQAQQAAALAKSGLSNSTTAADLRAQLVRDKISAQMQLEDKLTIMAEEYKQQKLQNTFNSAQQAENLTKMSMAEREQDVSQQLAESQADMQAAQADLQAQQINQTFSSEDEARRLQVDTQNQQADMQQRNQELALFEMNRNVPVQENEQFLNRRGQNFARETALRQALYGANPLLEGLQEFQAVNNVNVNNTTAANNAAYLADRNRIEAYRTQLNAPNPLAVGLQGVGGAAATYASYRMNNPSTTTAPQLPNVVNTLNAQQRMSSTNPFGITFGSPSGGSVNFRNNLFR